MSIVIAVEGTSQGQPKWDEFDVLSEQFSIRGSSDGSASFTLQLSDNLSVIGSGELRSESGRVRLTISQSVLVFEPDGASGGGNVSGVRFIVDLLSLPADSSLDALFSSSTSDGITGKQFSVDSISGAAVVEDPGQDVAGSVSVTKTNLDNSDLGETTVSFLVSADWHDLMRGSQQAPVIAKLSDSGELFYEQAVCARDGDGYICRVTFTGNAAGFSEFALVGVSAVPVTPVATSTPRPLPTATPTRVVSPTPTSAPPLEPTETPEGSRATQTPDPGTEPTPQVLPTPSLILPTSENDGVPFWAWIIGAVVVLAGLRVAWFGYSRVRSG